MKRPIPLALTALVAFFSALAALAVSGGHSAHAHGLAPAEHHHHFVPHPQRPITARELQFRNDMRKLWEDHVTWTRLAVISLINDSPDTNATVTRLLRNQDDIGDAIKPFYGNAAGNTLAQKLREHILIAADLIAAAKSGDQNRIAVEQERWHQNARDIAAFLSQANPRYWSESEITAMLFEHLRLTTDEVVARLQGNWDADVASYDRIHLHALGMADTLSTGIIAQFPRRFR